MSALYDALAILGGFALIAGLLWWCAKHAPWGWQDENDWHPGEPPKDGSE